MATKVELDKGYSWVILVTTFFYNIVEASVFCSPAVYMVVWSQLYDTSKAKVGLVGSVMNGMTYLMGIFIGPLVDKFNCRIVSYMGLALAILGFIFSSFCSSTECLVVTFGIILGTGEGLLNVPPLLVVQYYFEKNRPFASGISSVGRSVGATVMLPLLAILISYYGIKGTMVLHAGITMQNLVLASLFRPIDVKDIEKCSQKSDMDKEGKQLVPEQDSDCLEGKNSKNSLKHKDKSKITTFMDKFSRMSKVWDFSLFKDRAYVLLLIALVLQEFGIAVMYKFTSIKAVAHGVSTMEAAFLPSITGLSSVVGRIITSIVANLSFVNRTLLCGFAVFMEGVVIITSCMAWSFQTFSVSMGLFGLCYGTHMAIQMTVMTDFIGISKLAHGSSFLAIFIGISQFASFPVAGLIIDKTGNYDISYYIFGSFTCMAGTLILIIPYFFKTDKDSTEEGASEKIIDPAVFASLRSLHKM